MKNIKNADTNAIKAEKAIYRKDGAEAWKWANMSAAEGDPWGLYALAQCYLNGFGTSVDLETADELFRRVYTEKGLTRALTGQAAVLMAKSPNNGLKAYQLVRQAAEEGDAKALYLLALHYEHGSMVVKSHKRFLSLLRQSADLMYPMAMIGLAREHLSESSGIYDISKARELLRKPMELGIEEAILLWESVADSDEAGEDSHEASTELPAAPTVLDDYPAEKAILEGIERKAADGDHESLYFLGCYYRVGECAPGVPHPLDHVKAMELLKMAAEAGNSEAAFLLGQIYMAGEDEVSPDVNEGVLWLQRAVEMDNPKAMVNLAHFYGKKGETDKSMELLELAIKKHDDSVAKVQLAYYLLRQPDYMENRRRIILLASQAADQDCEYGYLLLGEIYCFGRFGEVDMEKAKHYFSRGANKGEVRSMFLLGCIYAGCLDNHDDTDFELAEELLVKASMQGDVDAMAYLGYLYVAHLNEKEMGEVLLRKAAAAGNVNAIDLLQFLKMGA